MDNGEQRRGVLPRFAAVRRFVGLPVVSFGVDRAARIYRGLKASNRIIAYGLENAEKTVLNVVHVCAPLAVMFAEPINRIDDVMCRSLDAVEQNIPFVTYTPWKIYSTAKSFVRARVDPVLKRADSSKQLIMLDDALNAADKYVDKYLPDKDPAEDEKPSPETSSQTVKTIRHVNHFSKKLQRRLTRRTIVEAQLLRKQGYDTVQCLLYFTDLLAKDPRMFAEKMKAIWIHLSKDEPENQKPPENIEELIEMLSREGARRFVHVTNFVVKNVYKAPEHARRAYNYAAQQLGVLMDRLIKYVRLDKAKDVVDAKLADFKKAARDPVKTITVCLWPAVGPDNGGRPADAVGNERRRRRRRGGDNVVDETTTTTATAAVGPAADVAGRRDGRMSVVENTTTDGSEHAYPAAEY